MSDNLSEQLDLRAFRVVTMRNTEILSETEHPFSKLVYEANRLGLDGKEVLSVSRRNPDPRRPEIEFVMYVEDLVQL